MEVELRNGFKARVDPEDWERFGHLPWYARRQGGGKVYVVYNQWHPGRKQHLGVRLHRLILDAPPHLYVDHIDGDGLNNSRLNIRLCTNAENQQNSTARRGSSRFKGVSWVTSKGKWRAAFRWDGRHYFVGYFDDELEAARAYNAAVLPVAGEFARPNPVPD